MSRLTMGAALLAAGILPAVSPPGARGRGSPSAAAFVPGEVLLEFRGGATPGDRAAVLAALGAATAEELGRSGVLRARIPEVGVEDGAGALRA